MEIEILTKNEINILNNSPKFAYEQKKYYFNINANLLKNLLTNYKIDSIAYFILFYGYFKVSNRFYTLSDDQIADLGYIQKRYSLPKSKEKIPTRTIRSYKSKIKQYLYVSEYSNEIKEIL